VVNNNIIFLNVVSAIKPAAEKINSDEQMLTEQLNTGVQERES
jgi:hypothetical protein